MNFTWSSEAAEQKYDGGLRDCEVAEYSCEVWQNLFFFSRQGVLS